MCGTSMIILRCCRHTGHSDPQERVVHVVQELYSKQRVMGTTTYIHDVSLSCVEGQRISQFFWTMTLQKRIEKTDPFLLLLIDNDYFINISISINIILLIIKVGTK